MNDGLNGNNNLNKSRPDNISNQYNFSSPPPQSIDENKLNDNKSNNIPNQTRPSSIRSMNRSYPNQFQNGGQLNKQTTSPIKNYKKKVAKEGAKKIANIFAPVVGGKVVDQLSKTEVGDKILNQVSDNASVLPGNPFKLLKSRKKRNEQQNSNTNDNKNSIKSALEIPKKITKFLTIAPGVISGCFSFLIIITVICVIISPFFYINSLLGKESYPFFEKIGNFLTLRGWCSNQECQEIEANNFYDEIQKIYNEYKEEKNVELNVNLIVATLTYIDPLVTSDKNEEIDGEDFNVEDFQSSNMVDFKKSKKMVKLLAENMVVECCLENGKEYECAEYPDKKLTCPADVKDRETGRVIKKYKKKYKVDINFYKEFLKNEFIRKFYYDNKTGPEIDKKIDEVIEQIFLRTEFYENLTNSQNGNNNSQVYAYCSGVTVVDENDNILGTYDLEDYVAGVVRHEVASNQGEEAHKALAVVARTYTLAVTNNCTVSIESSTNSQMATIEDVDDYASRAASATSGKILVYDNQIFATQYDSYCYNDSDCVYGEENGKLFVEYTKLPNGEKHKVYLSREYEQFINGGHGRGLSQVATYEMAANGSTYDEILLYFYSDGVSIVDMNTVLGGYNSSSQPPSSVDDLKARSEYYASLGTVVIGGQSFNLSYIYNGNASNLGQCVWYARSRALELILTSNMDDETKIQALNAVSSVTANGEGWYSHSSLSMFNKTTDSSMPIPGSIVSWSGGSTVCSPRCGHVAIVESVDYENQTITISEGWNSGGADGVANWGNVVYQTKTYTFDSIRGYSDPNRFSFNGYVYILGNGE